MRHDPKTIENRLHRVLARVEEAIHPESRVLPLRAWHCPGEPVDPRVAMAASFEPIGRDEAWGPMWGTTWFAISGAVPAEWTGKRVIVRIAFVYDNIEGFTVEALVYQNGKAVGAVNVRRDEIVVAAHAKGGEAFSFFLEAAANPSANYPHLPICRSTDLMPGSSRDLFGRVARSEIAWVDEEVFAFYHDFRVCLEVMAVLPETSARRGRIKLALHEAANTWDAASGSEGAAEGRKILAPVLAARNGDTRVHVTAVGHAHIDTAWLWPLRETMRKCARTFAMQLAYMDRYPDYRFSCSSALHYAWMKQRYPEIFAEIGRKVKSGQWEVVGSTWVEPDCNLPSGESFVRQIIHGKRFFAREFGVETRDLWLPDVFGYAASLPQVLRLAGIDAFFTQKISWNQTNRFPHQTFLWEGIDGTRVFTHFTPADSYLGTFEAKQVVRCERDFAQKDRCGHAMYVYGYGDGGGGPTAHHIESARRYADLEGVPPVSMGRVERFFADAMADARDLPIWVGELYLELHRGTYTTQAFMKRGNRAHEFALREAEFLLELGKRVSGVIDAAQASVGAWPMPPPRVYDDFPTEASSPIESALERAWRLLLLNQFHDIIPGSSIRWVYEDARRDMAAIGGIVGGVSAALLEQIVGRVDAGACSRPVLLLNSSSWAREEVVDLGEGNLRHVSVPAMGYSVVDSVAPAPEPADSVAVSLQGELHRLENRLLRVDVDSAGRVTCIFDKVAAREVLQAGGIGNAFTLHEDRPLFWDAWDVESYADEMACPLEGPVSVSIESRHALRASLRVRRQFGRSQIEQLIVLNAASRRIDFRTRVDWHEDRKLLRVAFPLLIRAPRVTREIQFGHVESPTHRNTSWEEARFEVCAHKWIDLSEGDYGVALLNDSKFGHSIDGGTLRLSLLRSPKWPDPTADRGSHEFTYSLFCHPGGFQSAGVIAEAYALNIPVRVVPLRNMVRRPSLPDQLSFVTVDRPALVIEAVKPAEDGNGTIVRLYEAHGTRGKARFVCWRQPVRVQRVDLLERPLSECPCVDARFVIDYRPFEIVSLRLEFAR